MKRALGLIPKPYKQVLLKYRRKKRRLFTPSQTPIFKFLTILLDISIDYGSICIGGGCMNTDRPYSIDVYIERKEKETKEELDKKLDEIERIAHRNKSMKRRK